MNNPIPYGRENAISREHLAAMLGTTDRKARRVIQSLRDEGVLICTARDGSGYYQVGPDDLDDLQAAYWADRHRALSILRRLKKMRRILKAAGREV